MTPFLPNKEGRRSSESMVETPGGSCIATANIKKRGIVLLPGVKKQHQRSMAYS